MDISGRIDRTAVFIHLKMEVRTGRTTSTTHQSDDIPFADNATGTYIRLNAVRVEGVVTLTRVDLNQLAVAVTIGRPGHATGGHGDNIGTLFTGKIDPRMPGQTAGKGIGTLTITGRHPAFGDRPAGNKGVSTDTVGAHQRTQHFQLLFTTVNALSQTIQNLVNFGHLIGFTERAGRAANSRLSTEIKLIRLQIGHINQAFTKRIQT